MAHRLIQFWEESNDWEESLFKVVEALIFDPYENWSWLWPSSSHPPKPNDCPITSKLLQDAPSSQERLMLTDNHPSDKIYHELTKEILCILSIELPSKPFPNDLQTRDIIYPRYPFNKNHRSQLSELIYPTYLFTQKAVDAVMQAKEKGDYITSPWYTAALQFNKKYFNNEKDVWYIARRIASGAHEGEIP